MKVRRLAPASMLFACAVLLGAALPALAEAGDDVKRSATYAATTSQGNACGTGLSDPCTVTISTDRRGKHAEIRATFRMACDDGRVTRGSFLVADPPARIKSNDSLKLLVVQEASSAQTADGRPISYGVKTKFDARFLRKGKRYKAPGALDATMQLNYLDNGTSTTCLSGRVPFTLKS